MSVNRMCAISSLRPEPQSDGAGRPAAEDELLLVTELLLAIEPLLSSPAIDADDSMGREEDSVSRLTRCRSVRISAAL